MSSTPSRASFAEEDGGESGADASPEFVRVEDASDDDDDEATTEVDTVVNAMLSALDAEYEATVASSSADAPAQCYAPPTRPARSAALSAALANRPELAAKLDALRAMGAAMRNGGGVGSETINACAGSGADSATDADFGDDYGALQAADSAAIAAALKQSNSPRAPVVPAEEVFQFGDFASAPLQASDDLAEQFPAFDAFASDGPVDGGTARAPPRAPVRAVSPLPVSTRSAILESMAKMHLSPRASPSAERTAAAALEAGRRAINAHDGNR